MRVQPSTRSTALTRHFSRGGSRCSSAPTGAANPPLLRALLSLEPLRGGALSAGDVVVKGGDALRAATAYLPQRPYLSERATVRESFELFFERAPAEAPLVEWLTRFGMLDVLRAKNADDPLAVRIGRLSSGQKQRVALARFCALDRPVWLLDEPDASLDAEGLALLESILREERANRIIVVAARSPSIARIADQVIACDGGRDHGSIVGHSGVTGRRASGGGARTVNRSGAPLAAITAKCSYAHGVTTNVREGSAARSARPRAICGARSASP
ncbi:MAG: ATP-binding cassette domain-containing protein [Polyangiaceae bacterium]